MAINVSAAHLPAVNRTFAHQYIIIQAKDIAYEEDILRDPHSLKNWWYYLDFKADAAQEVSSSHCATRGARNGNADCFSTGSEFDLRARLADFASQLQTVAEIP